MTRRAAADAPVGRPIHRLLAAALLFLWGLLAARLAVRCVRLDATFFRLALIPDRPWLTLPAALLPVLIFGGWRREPKRAAVALAPLALTLPLFYLPLTLWSVAALTLLTGWTAFRLARAGLLPGLPAWCVRHRRLTAGIVTAIALALAAQALAASRLAYDHLHLATTDWATYAEAAYNTFHGNWFHADYPEPCWSAGHFMPGFFLLAAPCFGLFPSVHTAFALNALLLFGGGLLLFGLGRKSGIDPFTAAAAALAWLLHPSVNNLNLCNFYGFNAEYLFIPFFFLFLWCRERGHTWFALALAALTLTFKETFGVFWAGWGLMQLAAGCAGGGRKRLAEGAAALAAGGLYHFLCIRWIIPQGSGGDYIFFAQYAQLGDDIPSILLSPIRRPGAFWGTLVHPKNLFVLLMIALPFLPGALGRWPVLGAPVLVIGFHFLRVSRDVVNLTQHYQLTLLCCGAGALLWGIPRLRPRGRLDRWLCCGFAPSAGRGNLRYAAALAALAAAVVGHWFFAQSFYGPNPLGAVTEQPDARGVIADLYKIVPAGATLAADESTAGHFLFRNPVSRLDGGDPAADWALEVQGDWKSPDALAVHAALLENPAFAPVRVWCDGVRKIYLFRRVAPGAAAPPPAVPESAPPPPGTPPFRQVEGAALWRVGDRIVGLGHLPAVFEGYPELRAGVLFSDGSMAEFSLPPENGLLPLSWLSGKVPCLGSAAIPPGSEPVDAAVLVRPIGAAPNAKLPPGTMVIDGLSLGF